MNTDEKVQFYKPIPPNGYKCIGFVAMKNFNINPPLNSIACVKRKYLVKRDLVWIWDTRGNGSLR